MVAEIRAFRGPYAFLSNFAECEILYEGLTFSSVEAAFQAAKTENFQDRERIAKASSPAEAKQLGRRVVLHNDWEEKKDSIMLGLLRLKFTRGSEMAKLLDATGEAVLVEGNSWHDQYWGVCNCSRHKGHGMNRLGQLLMQVRAENR